MGHIIYSGKSFELDCSSSSLLDAIRKAGIFFDAPCGGSGRCGDCTVLVKNDDALEPVLACKTKPTSDMVVVIEPPSTTVIDDLQRENYLALMMDLTQTNASQNEREPYSMGLGLAIDIGTTTLELHMVDLATNDLIAHHIEVNSQRVYGADVITRISACNDDKLPVLSSLIREQLANIRDLMFNSIEAKVRDDLYEQFKNGRETGVNLDYERAVITGNTTMLHLLMGIDPSSIGVSPFEPQEYFGKEVLLPKLAKHVFCMPCVSGYVGGDVISGLLAQGIYCAEADVSATENSSTPAFCFAKKLTPPLLYLDLGTNGEIALATPDRIITCATAAGPVFEGVHLSCGTTVRNGAITRVTLDDAGELVLEAQGMTSKEALEDARGLCGSSVISLAALLLEEGVITPAGFMNSTCANPALAARIEVTDQETLFRLAPKVYFSQADVRELQLAKAAIRSGIETLLEYAEMTSDDLQQVIIAGGIGYHLQAADVCKIGLVPKSLLTRFCAQSNTALQGALLTLLDTSYKSKSIALADNCEYIELSCAFAFTKHYLTQMNLEES